MPHRVATSALFVAVAVLLIVQGQATAARVKHTLASPPVSVSEITGSAMPRDVDTGTPSLKSDRLLIQLNSVQSPPAGFGLNCYLLTNEAGVHCGELPVAGGAVNHEAPFPGINLVGSYNTFRLTWEKPVSESTVPPAALSLIREVVHRATDTPNQVGYGVGMVTEAQLMFTHAGLARAAVTANNLTEARVHVEHVLNILYGNSDSRYGDHDGSGLTENPGDGFGILRYAANVQLKMLNAAESAGVTQHIADQAFAASVVVGNFSPADGSGAWSDELIAAAAQVMAAGTAGAASGPATEMQTLARRILEGVDANTNGTVEPVAGEGGAWTAFTTVQRTADYFPSGGITGVIKVEPMATNPTGDKLSINLSNVPQPPGGFSLWGYLVAPNGKRLILGELPWSSGSVQATFTYAGRNLIGEFDSFRLVQSALYAEETLALGPLGPIRKVLAAADDTPANTAYGAGLVQQAGILVTTANSIGAAVSANDLALAKQRAAQALNVLVGSGDPRYNAAAGNPGDGFGVLGYAGRLDQSMQETAASPGATANMVQRAGQARTAVAAFWPASGTGTLSDNLVAQLQQVIAADSTGSAAGPAGQAATLAGQILNGADGSNGARASYLAAQQAADYFPQEKGAPEPDAPPEPGVNPDALENDDLCSRAETIPTDGAPQNHTFHYEGDQDWVRFTAQANKTYVIEATGTGNLADPVIFLHDACNAPAASFESNAFGNTIRLLWNSTKNGAYYIQLRQFDPVQFGAGTEYTLKVTLDTAPPSPPINLRCLAINQTTLGLQWQRSQEPDVASYRITYSNLEATDTGIEDVAGAGTTFIELGGLTPNELYFLRVRALDYSRNESDPSGELQCRPVEPADKTTPVINALQPTLGAVYTTTAPALTFSGAAQDSSGNLSRAIVRNESTNQEKSDFSLAGGAAQFRVEDIPLRVGSNQIQVRVIDEANNSSTHNLEVRRLANSAGAALIVAGHNETFGLQTNIYNATNRAYRIFQSAGFSEDDIYYLAPVAQDATGDGVPDTQDIVLTPGAVQAAITGWAKARVGPDKPFFLYLMDHGFADKYCVTGCTAGNIITPAELNSWLREMEDASGVDEVNIVIEACQSGSFLDNLEGDAQNPLNSLARQGRVVVTSTGRVNNAYASADGAYFSDAFFSCLADSGSLKSCFDEGMDAVTLAGVDQTPWLDDNADGVFNNGDGSVATARTMTSFFSSVRPQITSTSVAFDGSSGLLRAQVTAGAEAIRLVWAAVYPPSFQEPDTVTLNLNVPVVRLEPVAGSPGRYEFNYVNGFSEQGDYRIIFYAQDRLGINAKPVGAGATPNLYLPNVSR